MREPEKATFLDNDRPSTGGQAPIEGRNSNRSKVGGQKKANETKIKKRMLGFLQANDTQLLSTKPSLTAFHFSSEFMPRMFELSIFQDLISMRIAKGQKGYLDN